MTADLSPLGWDETFARSYARFERSDRWPARVTRVDRGVCTVVGAEGACRSSLGGGLLAAAAADPTRLPCAGDWVVGRTWPDQRSTIEVVLPRRTAVIRAGAGARAEAQVLAANIDVAAVVEPLDPQPDLARIERLLALAWESGAEPIIILTKADLAADPRTIAAQVAEVAPGVPIHPMSAGPEARNSQADGVHALLPYLATGRTVGLIGVSGAGKSTIVNALVGASLLATRGLRHADGRGRHTTTYRSLVLLPGGGAVIDTPGIRAVGLFDVISGIERTFIDITAIAETCQFADCSHVDESGCAVNGAIAMGELSPRRVDRWRKLCREVAVAAERRDARIVAQERKRRRPDYTNRRTFFV